MSQRILQFLVLTSMMWLSWLTMMLVHETGHVVGAFVSGGTVRRLVWHPMALSRTEVSPNPHPLIEVSAGPTIGAVAPMIAAMTAHMLRLRAAYLVWFFAGFCLIANGAYVCVGAFSPIGDAKQLIAHGMPRYLLAIVGGACTLIGLWIWHRISASFGFGPARSSIRARDAAIALTLAMLVTAAGFAFGDEGA